MTDAPKFILARIILENVGHIIRLGNDVLKLLFRLISGKAFP